jgi:hypothetical protein
MHGLQPLRMQSVLPLRTQRACTPCACKACLCMHCKGMLSDDERHVQLLLHTECVLRPAQVKLVLQRNKFFVESPYPQILKTLLKVRALAR